MLRPQAEQRMPSEGHCNASSHCTDRQAACLHSLKGTRATGVQQNMPHHKPRIVTFREEASSSSRHSHRPRHVTLRGEYQLRAQATTREPAKCSPMLTRKAQSYIRFTARPATAQRHYAEESATLQCNARRQQMPRTGRTRGKRRSAREPLQEQKAQRTRQNAGMRTACVGTKA